MFHYGVDYYPEHWPEERWPEDVRMMAEAGFNIVRLAEFAWSKLEPHPGEYDFTWLDRAIDLLSAHGMCVVLGTPTASPPAWLMTQHPEYFRVRIDGTRMTYGHRREYCPTQLGYHEETRRIVTKLATHYGKHPAVIGWQIDNEFGDRCYCTSCAREFRRWLRARYESLDELNEGWGTAFWSHTYQSWDEIPVPLSTSNWPPNPGLALDFYRFASDAYVHYQRLQVEILRSLAPQHLITHNLMGFKYGLLNYYDLAADLDLVSWDNYPRTQWRMHRDVDPSFAALNADTMRSLKGKNVWVMEQQTGPGGSEYVSVAPRPGELRLWAYQSIAHGADGIIFFRWRTARTGAEQYWHGVLDHHGRPGRRYAEVRRMGGEIKQVGSLIAGSESRNAVALLNSYDSRFAFEIQGNNPNFRYAELVQDYYRALHRRQIGVDVVAPTADLSAYRLVIAPALHVLTATEADRLRRFVEGGGTLLVTCRSGVKDATNTVVDSPLPGLLAELCGVTVKEYDSLPPDANNSVLLTLPNRTSARYPVKTWCDILELHGATPVGTYDQDYMSGEYAVTVHRVGKGNAIYVGTIGDAAFYDALTDWLLSLAGVGSAWEAQDGIEIVSRWQGEQQILFVLNHSSSVQNVRMKGSYVDAFDKGAIRDGALTVQPRDVRILLAENATR